MIAVFDPATDVIREIVNSTSGVDLTGMATIDTPEGFNPAGPSHLLEGGSWVINTGPALAEMRRERDARLFASDWTQLADIAEATRLAWQPYRQALRDLPENTIDPTNPVWPTPPE